MPILRNFEACPVTDFFVCSFMENSTCGKRVKDVKARSKVETIRIHHKSEGWMEKSVPRITDWHHKTC